MPANRAAMTLAEVAIALLLTVVAVVTVLSLLASGMRMQQQVRYGQYAAAAAVSLMDGFSQGREDLSAAPVGVRFARFEMQARYSNQAVADRAVGLTAGQFDLERQLNTALEGMYTVPPEIARRLDSPGGEIVDILDQGGQIYYLDPFGSTGCDRGTSQIGTDRGAVPELQRLVFAVVGNAQQNLLPLHPYEPPIRLLYPFPPQAGERIVPRKWGGGSAVYGGYPQGYSGDLAAVDRGPKDADAINPSPNPYGYTAGPNQGFELNTWEWRAVIDEKLGRSPAGSGSWVRSATWSPWRAGLPEFRRLAFAHWLRIQHQIGLTGLPSASGGGGGMVRVHGGKMITRKVKVTRTVENRDRSISTIEEEIEVKEPDPNDWKWVAAGASGGGLSARGIPSPPIGLPMAKGLRGTDLLYEDHESCRKERLTQLRIGLPGLERRVMYRTAALALWAKVDGHASIIAAAPELLGTAADPGSDPNVADLADANLPAARNPLLGVVEPPPNPRDIHPAQVLALSHLAHAAMLTTGYQPPFVAEQNSPDPSLHTNLVPDESAPFKELTSQEYWLWDPMYVATANGRDPKFATEPDSEAAGADVLPDTVASTDKRICRDVAGQPIRIRRSTGPIINPFPPPYADRGAFDWRGIAYNRPQVGQVGTAWRITWTSANYRQPSTSGFTAADPSDTAMARHAHETALRWAMAYVSAFPNDGIVPKPLNRQTCFDQPLFGYDLFRADGTARRPGAWGGFTDGTAFHPITWGQEQATFPITGTGAYRALSFAHWRKASDNPQWGEPPPFGIYDAVTYAGQNPLRPEDVNRLDLLALLKPHGKASVGSSAGYTMGMANDRPATPLAKQRHLNRIHDLPYGAPASKDELRDVPAPHRARWWYPQRFEVADRCRELVFWAVDWKQYEDAESAPSAPIDTSQAGRSGASPLVGAGNPEAWLCWITPARDGTPARPPAKFTMKTAISGAGMVPFDNRVSALGGTTRFTNIPHDTRANNILWIHLGIWGADRNGNGVWDKGPVKAGVRMRAVEVGRFTYYDPVLWTTTRN